MSRCTLLRCMLPAWMFAFLCVITPLALADELPRDAKDAVAAHDEDAEAIRAEAEKKLAKRKAELVFKLGKIHEDFTKAGKKDEAAAVRDLINKLTETYPAGMFVDVEWRGSWYEAKVLEAKDGNWYITYDGYGPEWDEWVDKTRIRARDKAMPGIPGPQRAGDF